MGTRLVMALTCCAVLLFGAGSLAVDLQPRGLNVGFRTLEYPLVTEDGQSIPVSMWYPTTAPPTRHLYAPPALDGAVAEESAIAPGRHPVLFFSHGCSDSAVSYPYLTEGFARAGWIVLAPDYPDRRHARSGWAIDARTFARFETRRDAWLTTLSYRPRMLRRVLEAALSDPRLAGLIDRDRVALAGHSLGAATSLALCGTFAPFETLPVKAAVLLSPGGPVLAGELLAHVRTPILLMHGESEDVPCRRAPDGTLLSVKQANLRNFFAVRGPAELVELSHASHNSFESPLDPKNPYGQGTTEQLGAILETARAFLGRHVLHEPRARETPAVAACCRRQEHGAVLAGR